MKQLRAQMKTTKKKKKGPKAKKVTTKGRKPRYIEDGKDDSKKNDDGFKCGACKDVHTAIEALKGNYIKPNSFRCRALPNSNVIFIDIIYDSILIYRAFVHEDGMFKR